MRIADLLQTRQIDPRSFAIRRRNPARRSIEGGRQRAPNRNTERRWSPRAKSHRSAFARLSTFSTVGSIAPPCCRDPSRRWVAVRHFFAAIRALHALPARQTLLNSQPGALPIFEDKRWWLGVAAANAPLRGAEQFCREGGVLGASVQNDLAVSEAPPVVKIHHAALARRLDREPEADHGHDVGLV